MDLAVYFADPGFIKMYHVPKSGVRMYGIYVVSDTEEHREQYSDREEITNIYRHIGEFYGCC